MPTIGDALARMDALLSGWDATGDHRAVFVRSYRAVTERMERAVRGDEFEDSPWMEALDVAFADEYFNAVDAYAADGPVPECWRLAFDLAISRRTTVLQDLLLGMNAHIVHDLPIALAKVGTDPARQELRHRDHDRVNEVLAGMIDSIQRDISRHYSLLLGVLDRLGDTDEMLTDAGIRVARAEAWHQGLRLAASRDQEERARRLAELDRTASVPARILAEASSPLRTVIATVRSWDSRLARWFRG